MPGRPSLRVKPDQQCSVAEGLNGTFLKGNKVLSIKFKHLNLCPYFSTPRNLCYRNMVKKKFTVRLKQRKTTSSPGKQRNTVQSFQSAGVPKIPSQLRKHHFVERSHSNTQCRNYTPACGHLWETGFFSIMIFCIF